MRIKVRNSVGMRAKIRNPKHRGREPFLLKDKNRRVRDAGVSRRGQMKTDREAIVSTKKKKTSRKKLTLVKKSREPRIGAPKNLRTLIVYLPPNPAQRKLTNARLSQRPSPGRLSYLKGGCPN